MSADKPQPAVMTPANFHDARIKCEYASPIEGAVISYLLTVVQPIDNGPTITGLEEICTRVAGLIDALRAELADTRATLKQVVGERDEAMTGKDLQHLCCDGHSLVRWAGDGEMCPACVAFAEASDSRDEWKQRAERASSRLADVGLSIASFGGDGTAEDKAQAVSELVYAAKGALTAEQEAHKQTRTEYEVAFADQNARWSKDAKALIAEKEAQQNQSRYLRGVEDKLFALELKLHEEEEAHGKTKASWNDAVKFHSHEYQNRVELESKLRASEEAREQHAKICLVGASKVIYDPESDCTYCGVNGREVLALRSDLAKAREEISTLNRRIADSEQKRTVAWREAHVLQRIAVYRNRLGVDWCDTCLKPQMVLPNGEHGCATISELYEVNEAKAVQLAAKDEEIQRLTENACEHYRKGSSCHWRDGMMRMAQKHGVEIQTLGAALKAADEMAATVIRYTSNGGWSFYQAIDDAAKEYRKLRQGEPTKPAEHHCLNPHVGHAPECCIPQPRLKAEPQGETCQSTICESCRQTVDPLLHCCPGILVSKPKCHTHGYLECVPCGVGPDIPTRAGHTPATLTPQQAKQAAMAPPEADTGPDHEYGLTSSEVKGEPHEFEWAASHSFPEVYPHDWSWGCGEPEETHQCRVCSKPYSDAAHR